MRETRRTVETATESLMWEGRGRATRPEGPKEKANWRDKGRARWGRMEPEIGTRPGEEVLRGAREETARVVAF